MFRRPVFRLQYASNLFGTGWSKLRPAPKTPYLAILGNSLTAEHPSYLPQLDKALSFFKENWDMTLIVPGPLEYSCYKGLPQARTSVMDTLRGIIEPYERISLWEQGDWLVRREGVRLLGFTGWMPGLAGPSVSEAMQIAPISLKGGPPSICYAEDDSEWLDERLKEDIDVPTVVLSHSLPNPFLLQRGLSNTAYMRTKQDIYTMPNPLGKNVKAWLGGATGSCSSGMYRGVFTAVNGYRACENSTPNPQFNPSAVYEFDFNTKGGAKVPVNGGGSLARISAEMLKRSPAPAFLTQLN